MRRSDRSSHLRNLALSVFADHALLRMPEIRGNALRLAKAVPSRVISNLQRNKLVQAKLVTVSMMPHRNVDETNALAMLRMHGRTSRPDLNSLIEAWSYRGSVKMVRALLIAGARPSPRALVVAANSHHRGTPAVVNELIRAGVNVNNSSQGITPLYSLLMSKEDFYNPYYNSSKDNSSNDYDNNYHATFRRMFFAKMNLLLRAGADVNKVARYGYEGSTPLMRSLMANYEYEEYGNFLTEIVRRLIAAGTDVNIKDINGNSALHLLASSCKNIEYSIELLNLLLRAGADVNSQNIFKRSVLENFIRNKKFSFDLLDTIYLPRLLGYGANVNQKNPSSGVTPLMVALDEGRGSDIIKMLIRVGADVNAKDNAGNTPLLHAVKSSARDVEAVKTLVQAGADVTVGSKNNYGKVLTAGAIVAKKWSDTTNKQRNVLPYLSPTAAKSTRPKKKSKTKKS